LKYTYPYYLFLFRGSCGLVATIGSCCFPVVQSVDGHCANFSPLSSLRPLRSDSGWRQRPHLGRTSTVEATSEQSHHHGQHRPLTSCLACCIRNLQPGFQRKIFNSPAPNDMFQFAPTNRRPLSPIGIGACGLHENSKATTRTSYTGFLAQLSIHYGRCHVESWLMTHALLWTNQWKDQCPTRTLDIQFRPRTL
jgi:hypothetical protein